MWQSYYAPGNLDGALELLPRLGDGCRPVAGGTDLILEIERGVRSPKTIVDLSRIVGLDCVEVQDGHLLVGATATHNQVVANADAVARAFPLARACWQVGAPQIRNRGTVVGNLVTASPANDTITPLWALDATVTLVSQARGERTLSFPEFFLGVRRTALAADELVARVNVPLLGPGERGTFLKLGLRQAQAISVVNVAATIDTGAGSFDADLPLRGARIALGAVAPTIVRATEAEEYLAGKVLSDAVIERAAALAADAGRPISDIRGSAEYRKEMTRVLVEPGADAASATARNERSWPARPVLLWGGSHPAARAPRPAGPLLRPRPSDRERQGADPGERRRQDAAASAARGCRPHRHQRRLRRGRVRRLHRLAGRRGGDELPGAGRARRRLRGGDHRGTGADAGDGRDDARSTRCSRPSSTRARFSAATARPAF